MNATEKKEMRHAAILFITIVGLSLLVSLFLGMYAEGKGEKLMKPLNEVSQIQFNDSIHCLSLNTEEHESLVLLNDIIQKHKKQHEITFLTLYQYHYTSEIMFLVFSILAALMVFLITQKGWKDATVYTKTLFVASTALASFYGLSFSTFKQEIGITENGKAYISYDNLQKEILNYCVTNEPITIEMDTLTFNKFHTGIMKKIKAINSFHLEFDKDEIDTQNMFNLHGQ